MRRVMLVQRQTPPFSPAVYLGWEADSGCHSTLAAPGGWVWSSADPAAAVSGGADSTTCEPA